MQMNIGIEDKAREMLAERLGVLLADTYTLYLKTHNYHWNVSGPMFQTLHAMFETQYQELWVAADDLAERIRTLGHIAPGGYAAFGRLSNVPDTDGTPGARAMIRLLKDGHETVIDTARKVISVAEEAGDRGTADLATQRLRVHEKTVWMLRSLLEEQ